MNVPWLRPKEITVFNSNKFRIRLGYGRKIYNRSEQKQRARRWSMNGFSISKHFWKKRLKHIATY
jgi:hypothetical protein